MAQDLPPSLRAKRFQRTPESREPSIWDPWLAERGEFEPRQAWPAPTYQYWWPYPFPPPEVPGMPSPLARLGDPEAAARRIADTRAATRGMVSSGGEPGNGPGNGSPPRGGTGIGVGALALLSPFLGSVIGRGIQRVMGGGTPTPQGDGSLVPSPPDTALGDIGGGSSISLSPGEMEQASTGTAASDFDPFLPDPTAVALGGGNVVGGAPLGGGFDPYSGVHAGFESAPPRSPSLLGPALAAAGTAYGIGQMVAAGEPTYGGMSSAVPGALSLGASLLGPAGAAGPVGLMAATPFAVGSLVHSLLSGGRHQESPVSEAFHQSVITGDRATGEAILRAYPDVLGWTMADWDTQRAEYLRVAQEQEAQRAYEQAYVNWVSSQETPPAGERMPVPSWWTPEYGTASA